MAKTFSLCNGSVKLVQLRKEDVNIELHQCSPTIDVAIDQGRAFSVVVKGFITPLVLEVSASAIARSQGESFDIDVGIGLSDLIDTVIANAELIGINTEKFIRLDDRALSNGELRASAQKNVQISDGSVANSSLLSFAYSVDMDDAACGCVARSEFGDIVLMRLRMLSDDLDYLMTDDAELNLNELYRFEETG